MIVFVGLILFTVVGLPKQFFFSMWGGKFLFLEMSVCMGSFVLFITILKTKYIEFAIPRYAFGCFCLLIYLFISRLIIGVDTIFSEGLLLAVYSIMILIFVHNIKNRISDIIEKCISLILIIGLFQVILSMGQIAGLFTNDFSNYAFGGTLGNPNILSIYLTPIVVLAFGLLLFQKHNRLQGVLASFTALGGTGLLLYASCRTACLSVLISISILIFIRIRSSFGGKKIAIVFFSVIFVLVLLLIPFLYQFRPESIKGRIWIWKIAWQMFLDKPFLGHGLGNFEKSFANYQVEYFLHDFTADKYLYNADHITKGFNDLLQFICEVGIFGFSFLILALIWFFKTNPYKNVIASQSKYYIIICSSLFSLGLCSLSYFPFSIIPIVTLTVVLLLLLSLTTEKYSKSNLSFQNNKWFILILITAALGIFIRDIKHLVSLRHFSKVEQMCKESNWQEALLVEPELDYYISKNTQACYLYGQIFESNSLPSKAIDCYEMAYTQTSDYIIALRLGICYLKTKQYEKAKETLGFVRLQIPYLLRPKILLMKLFHKMGDTDEAVKMAYEIIETKAKFEDDRSKRIKKSAINYLKRIKDNEAI